MRIFDFYARGEAPPRWMVWVSPFVVVLLGMLSLYGASTQPSFTLFLKELGSAKFGHFFWGHFGVALVIAGVVGIGYEVFSHDRRLRMHIDTLTAINSEVADEQLDAVLKVLLPGRKVDAEIHGQVRDYTVKLIRSLKRLEHMDVRPTIVSLKFTALLLRYATNAAEALSSEISEAGEYRLVLPASSAALADEILAEQLHQLRRGDSYSVISDFSTWRHNQLPKFWAELQQTAKRPGIQVRRLFCRFQYDGQLTDEDVFRVLSEHWTLATARHSMRMRTSSYNVGIAFMNAPEHVGVFRYRRGNNFVSFQPHGHGTLERMTISRRDDCPEFPECWAEAINSCVVGDMAALVRAIRERDANWWDGFQHSDGFDASAAAVDVAGRTRRLPSQVPQRPAAVKVPDAGGSSV